MTTVTLSTLAGLSADFLAYKRGLGHPYRRGEATLRSFLRFAQQPHHAGRRTSRPGTVDFALTLTAWLSRIQDRKPVTVANDLGVIRQFCLYCRRHRPAFFVPEHALAPQTESTYAPYIFSRQEISQLLQAAGQHEGNNIQGVMLRTLLLILYCTGLRFGEAIRLRLSDVDLVQCILHIRESKGRNRLVPFGSDVAQAIGTYLRWRASIVKSTGALDQDALFVRRSGLPLTPGVASYAVRRLLRMQGLKPPRGRIGPRPYDFRHAFAVHRLTEWYHQGVDLQTRLPWLSAYMGHANIMGTEDYLHATAELLQFAAARFEHRFRAGGSQV